MDIMARLKDALTPNPPPPPEGAKVCMQCLGRGVVRGDWCHACGSLGYIPKMRPADGTVLGPDEGT